MNSNLSYKGVVTLATKLGDKTIEKKVYNNGTNLLFELYARALAGQQVSLLIPSYIDVGGVRDIDGVDIYESHTKESLPVIVTYLDKVRADEGGYSYGVPFTRVEAILTRNMFNEYLGDNTKVIRLMSSDNRELALVNVEDLGNTIKTLIAGTQMIVVWDLYVTNKEQNTTTGGNI